MDQEHGRIDNGRNNESVETNQTELHWLTYAAPVELLLSFLSVIFLTALVISYLAIKKLRTSEAGQMVLNMSASLILHHLALFVYTFVYFSEIPVFCIITETLVIYSGIVLMLLMFAEAVNLLFKIVIVFMTIDNYVLKASVVAWITPIFLVGISTSVTFYAVIQEQSCDPEEITNKTTGLVAFAILTQLAIWIIFFIITVALLRSSHKTITTQNYNSTRMKELQKNVRVLFTVSVLLGLPWIIVLVGYFIRSVPNVGAPFVFIAALIDYLQGPLLFLVQGVRLTEVRQLWKRWLCCRCGAADHASSQQTNGSRDK